VFSDLANINVLASAVGPTEGRQGGGMLADNRNSSFNHDHLAQKVAKEMASNPPDEPKGAKW
jgi:hypothetical protein